MEVDANEDAPEDVKRATSVSREIKRGEKDDTFEGHPRKEEKKKKLEHCDKPSTMKFKQTAVADFECCRGKREKKKRKLEKFMKVSVSGPPCAFPKLEIVPRHCLNKQEYIDMLANPSRKCPPECQKEDVLRRVKPVSARIKELAQPTRQRILITLRERAATLPPALLDNLIHTLEQETCFTPEQATKVSQSGKRKKMKTDSRRDLRRAKETTKSKIRRASTTSAGSLDRDAVSCQYLIAERFVKHLLKWKCPIPKTEFQDIAEVIKRRLLKTMEWSDLLPGSENRESQQIRFLADIVASWIAGVLSEVAENHRQALEEQCKKREEEMKTAEEEEETEDENEERREEDEDREEGTDEEEDFDKKKELYEDALDKEPGRKQQDRDEKKTTEGEERAADIEETFEIPEEKEESKVGINDEEARRASMDESRQESMEKPMKVEPIEEPITESTQDPIEKLETKVKAELAEVELGEPVKTEMKFDTQTESTHPTDTTDEFLEPKIEPGLSMETKEQKEVFEPIDEPKKEQDDETIERPADEPGQDSTLVLQDPKQEVDSKYTLESEEPKLIRQPDLKDTVSVKVVEEPVALEIGEEKTDDDLKKVDFKEQEEPTTDVDISSSLMERDEESVAMKHGEIPKEVELKESEKIGVSYVDETLKSIDIGDTFRTDLPFLTCDKIIDTLYKMVENSPENDGKDPTTNRIHRAIYEKLYYIVECENPKLLTEELKDVMDVTCGKISVWLKSALTKSQIDFMERYVPEVESREIREWLSWLISVSNVADNWTIWLRRVIEDIQSFQGVPVTRGEWQDWTSSVDTAALLWRRFHLQTIHQAHRNVSMLTGRKTVKTGTKSIIPSFLLSAEELIRTTDLHA